MLWGRAGRVPIPPGSIGTSRLGKMSGPTKKLSDCTTLQGGTEDLVFFHPAPFPMKGPVLVGVVNRLAPGGEIRVWNTQ